MGLSCVDLKNHGIPLDELDSPHVIIPVDLRFCRSDDGISHSTPNNPPYPSRINNANRESKLWKRSLATWEGINLQQNPLIQHSIEKQPTDTDGIYLVESIFSQQHSFAPSQPCNGVFYYHQLDPRGNQKHKKHNRTFPSDSFDSIQKPQVPVIIPTSQIFQLIPKEKDLVELSSDPWQFNRSLKPHLLKG